jgi:hypothetical protein
MLVLYRLLPGDRHILADFARYLDSRSDLIDIKNFCICGFLFAEHLEASEGGAGTGCNYANHDARQY